MIGNDRNIFIPSRPCKIKHSKIKNKKINSQHLVIKDQHLPFLAQSIRQHKQTQNHAFFQYYQSIKHHFNTITPTSINLNFSNKKQKNREGSIHRLQNMQKMKKIVSKNPNYGQSVEMLGQRDRKYRSESIKQHRRKLEQLKKKQTCFQFLNKKMIFSQCLRRNSSSNQKDLRKIEKQHKTFDQKNKKQIKIIQDKVSKQKKASSKALKADRISVVLTNLKQLKKLKSQGNEMGYSEESDDVFQRWRLTRSNIDFNFKHATNYFSKSIQLRSPIQEESPSIISEARRTKNGGKQLKNLKTLTQVQTQIRSVSPWMQKNPQENGF